MDSGNEVIIFEENFASATNNGINGNYEEVILVAPPSSNASTTNAGEQQQQQNMKTRSKGTENASTTASSVTTSGASAVAAEDASSTKSKLRSTRTDKTAPVASSEASGDKKETSKKPPAAVMTAAAKKAIDNTPTKRKAAPTAPTTTTSANGEDDSGINSRSSSVSNEDATYSSRMRTRSKTAEALSSSTPASTKKGASRMPLSTYDFDEDISILDDYPSTSGSSLKRKAVYVEEMEEPAEPEVEPPPKRVALQNAGLGLVNALLYPLRAIRGRVSSVASQTEASKGEANINDAASQTHVSKVNDDDPEKENVASQTDINGPSQTAAIDKASSSTCRVM